jgi:hypothetical protein
MSETVASAKPNEFDAVKTSIFSMAGKQKLVSSFDKSSH